MLADDALDTLFRTARSQNGFLDRPVAPETLRALYDLMKFGPTSANCSPLRIVFLVSPEAKRKLLPALSPGNVDKTMSAPVVAVLGHDLGFFRHAQQLFPHRPAMFDAFAQNPELAATTAFRNGSLQAAYLMLAARALGLDCGPMSGFDEAAVQRLFFPFAEQVRVNFLCNLGFGDPGKVFARLPRLPFDAACTIA
ncbi:malonic semialdehyde reductase [Pseudorhodoferax sp.]|uniref:malonic semialdehyde reductase n=1 Tax=Pseudorhodoferax sp. TaxID=1993553 RepID=UPI002DD6756B|nr:malonic semialdehyde reductase [Pseudorhodoferax sp.]